MKIRTVTLCAFFALACLCPNALSAGNEAPPADLTEKDCPPVANIKVEMLQGGKALISWDAAAGAPKYFVKLVDENQNTLLDTALLANMVMVDGLVAGVEYKVSVCYICPKTGGRVCAYKTFRYIIIEDQVVMFDGSGACECAKPVGTEGACNSSQSAYYSLESSRVYNIHLMDNSTISFLCDESSVNPVGNCPLEYGGMGSGLHGDFGSVLPYYEVGMSKIYFHGTTFCIQGEPVESVTYCNIATEKEQPGDGASATDKAYPNPFSDLLLVETEAGEETFVRLFDATGRLALERNVRGAGPFPLQTEHLAPGLYWLSIGGEGRVRKTERLVKTD